MLEIISFVNNKYVYFKLGCANPIDLATIMQTFSKAIIYMSGNLADKREKKMFGLGCEGNERENKEF